MSGLEIITKTIRDDASAEAQTVLAKARADAAQILLEAKAVTDAACEKIAEDGRRKAADIRIRAESEAELERRRALLERKRLLLDEAARAAREALLALPEDEYFGLLIRLAARSAEPGSGVMLLPAKDLARLPEGFPAALNAALPDGSTLEISADGMPLDGGFILRYGDIEQNCSLSSMFDEKRERILDAVREALFP